MEAAKAKARKRKEEKDMGTKGKETGIKGGGYYNYMSSGMGVGKGRNYMNEDWYNVWGE